MTATIGLFGPEGELGRRKTECGGRIYGRKTGFRELDIFISYYILCSTVIYVHNVSANNVTAITTYLYD